jgi:hypothetical protein
MGAIGALHKAAGIGERTLAGYLSTADLIPENGREVPLLVTLVTL